MRVKSYSIFSLLAMILLLSSGCAALVIGAGAGAGTVAYVAGELQATDDVPLNTAWNASKRAMKNLGFSITSKQIDAFEGKLIARGANDKKITISLEKVADKTTEIGIRIGIFGDESKSLNILEAIRAQY
jgi:hypothetical protein